MTSTTRLTTTAAIGRYADGTEAVTELGPTPTLTEQMRQALGRDDAEKRNRLALMQRPAGKANKVTDVTPAPVALDGLVLRSGGATIGVVFALAVAATVYGGPVPLPLIAVLAALFLIVLAAAGLTAHVRGKRAHKQGR